VEPIAIISDIHANAEALAAVLADIRNQGVKRIACLGDLMGYGPDPEKVVDMIRETCDIVIAGNHDWGVLKRPIPFNPHAAELINHHQCRMTPRIFDFIGRRKVRWKFLEKLQTLYQEDELMFVHGSLRQHVMEYVFPDKTSHFNQKQVQDLCKQANSVLFCGHTHLPCVIRDDMKCYYSSDEHPEVTLSKGHKHIVNPGSVGQPRDGDNRAGYCIFFGEKVRFRRVKYDVDTTCKKMLEIDGAARMMAGRLMRGE
jgi:predicted phosphodiesterase